MRTFWNTNRGLHTLDQWAPGCWVQVTCPTQDDATYLQNELGIPDYFLDDIADTEERARYDYDDGWVLIILRIPFVKEVKSRTPFTTIPLGIILKGDVCITVCNFEIQKFSYLPEPYNDFIFAIVCEEMGMFGAIIVMTLFAALIIRGIKIATEAPDTFGSLVVVGIIAQVAIQTVLNIAVATSTVPNTGVALPFFSYGGTSLLVLLAEMGIVLSVSRYSKK